MHPGSEPPIVMWSLGLEEGRLRVELGQGDGSCTVGHAGAVDDALASLSRGIRSDEQSGLEVDPVLYSTNHIWPAGTGGATPM